MSGCGVGFSVESKYVEKPSESQRQIAGYEPDLFVVPDTTDGWIDALRAGMNSWLEGKDMRFDYSLVRLRWCNFKSKRRSGIRTGTTKNNA